MPYFSINSCFRLFNNACSTSCCVGTGTCAIKRCCEPSITCFSSSDCKFKETQLLTLIANKEINLHQVLLHKCLPLPLLPLHQNLFFLFAIFCFSIHQSLFVLLGIKSVKTIKKLIKVDYKIGSEDEGNKIDWKQFSYILFLLFVPVELKYHRRRPCSRNSQRLCLSSSLPVFSWVVVVVLVRKAPVHLEEEKIRPPVWNKRNFANY